MADKTTNRSRKSKVLSDTTLKALRPEAKPYKVSDSGGLFILVQPSGGKLWRLKFRVGGVEKKLALGTYPDVSLAEARKRRDAARQQLASGRDPTVEKRRERLRAQTDAANTFDVVARDYFEKRQRDQRQPWAKATLAKQEFLLAKLSPALGSMAIGEIEPMDVLVVAQGIEARGTLETARRALQLASAVFRYGVATARLTSDPTRDLKGALAAPAGKNRAAIVDAKEVGELLRAIRGYGGQASTRLALQLAPHLFVRPGELRAARWEEFDFDESVWTIPAAKTKMRKAHHVPLSRQALAILNEARSLTSRATGYVFPSVRTSSRPLSENTLNAALRRLGYGVDEMTTHGFRSMAATLLNEARDPRTKRSLWNADAIERALAHGDSDKVRAAYHRGEHWEERCEMAQWWSDYLDRLRDGADVVPFKRKAKG